MTIEASIFFHMFFSFFDGHFVNVHRIRISSCVCIPWCKGSLCLIGFGVGCSSAISFILRYCASYLDACSYHSSIRFGMVGYEKIFWRIPTFNPSMKYSISVVLSVILALPDRIFLIVAVCQNV